MRCNSMTLGNLRFENEESCTLSSDPSGPICVADAFMFQLLLLRLSILQILQDWKPLAPIFLHHETACHRSRGGNVLHVPVRAARTEWFGSPGCILLMESGVKAFLVLMFVRGCRCQQNSKRVFLARVTDTDCLNTKIIQRPIPTTIIQIDRGGQRALRWSTVDDSTSLDNVGDVFRSNYRLLLNNTIGMS